MRERGAPRPRGYGFHRELFPRHTGEGFDPINPAAIAADVTIGFVLQPDRAARMVAQSAVDQSLPGLGEVIDRLVRATFDQATTGSYEAEVKRSEERVLVDRLMWLTAVSPNPQVRAMTTLKLNTLAKRVGAATPGTGSQAEAERAHRALIAADIKRFVERPVNDALSARFMPPPPAPPGAPIGDTGMDFLSRPNCSWDVLNPGQWFYYEPQ